MREKRRARKRASKLRAPDEKWTSGTHFIQAQEALLHNLEESWSAGSAENAQAAGEAHAAARVVEANEDEMSEAEGTHAVPRVEQL